MYYRCNWHFPKGPKKKFHIHTPVEHKLITWERSGAELICLRKEKCLGGCGGNEMAEDF